MSRSESHTRSPGFGSYLPTLVLIVLSTLALGTLQMRPSARSGDQVAVVFSPGTSLAEAIDRIARADGTAIRTGAFSNIVVAAGSQPGFADRLRKRGAWLVVDPYGLGGCLLAPVDATGTGRGL